MFRRLILKSLENRLIFRQQWSSNVQINSLHNVLQKFDEINTSQEYERLKFDMFNYSERITPINIESAFLNSCIEEKKFKLAMSYINYTKKQKTKLNLSTIGKLFRLYHAMYSENKITEEQENQILQLYLETKEEYKLLDSVTNEAVIMALAITRHWKRCLNTLDEIKISCKPSTFAYHHTIATLFKNNENDLAWNLLKEMIDSKLTPPEDCYLAYIGAIKNNKNGKAQIENLFKFFENNDIVPSETLIRHIIEALKLKNYNISTSISKFGNCSTCKQSLQRFYLTQEEYIDLKEAFLDKVIVGKDVFRKTTPEELKNFKEFLKTNKKYDVVIDGLNVAYSAGVNKSIQTTSFMVASVIRHFADNKKRILVLGRVHMAKWPHQTLAYIKRNADLFLTQNLSQDDPYLLYCALNSGLNTILVTRDLMRSHLYLLKEVKYKKLFSRWLSQSQYHLITVKNDGTAIFKQPQPYLRTSQKVLGTWHIPYTYRTDQDPHWLCVKV